MKNKKQFNNIICLVLFISILLILPSRSYANEFENPMLIKNNIKAYYEASYDIYLNMEMKPLDEYLDLDSIQSQNKVIILQRSVDTWKYLLEKGYMKQDPREKYPIYFDYKSIKTDVDKKEAEAIVNITIIVTEKQEAYPMFVSPNENIFKLRLKNDKWVIYEHDYFDPAFEVPKDKLIEYSKEKRLREIDEDYNPGFIQKDLSKTGRNDCFSSLFSNIPHLAKY